MRLSRKIIITCVLFLSASLVQAHEFWLQPTRFQFKTGDTMEVDFMVGTNFEGEFWELKKQRVAKLLHFSADQSESLLNLVQDGKGKKISYSFQNEGTHLFAMQSNNSFMKMDGEKFNAYLKEDGLDEILEQRTQAGTLGDSARENYARCAKLLVQAGDQTDETYKQIVGLALEIVPLSNPYAIKKAEELKFKVFFHGKPLPFTQMKVWNRGQSKTFVQSVYTDKDGAFTTRLSNSGLWMISTVKMSRSKQASADWQSFWASLVFGF
jgi:uncharacterized GH25 family protein